MSFTPPNAVPYRSAAQTDARPAFSPRKRYLLPQDCPIQLAAYTLDQEYEQLISSFAPVKNTLSTSLGLSDANAILTAVSQPSPTGAGLGKFTASFSRVPAPWDDFPTQVVTFPGIRDVAYTGGVRDPFSRNVTIRVRHDYFVISDGTPNITGVKDSGGTNSINVVSSKGIIQQVYRTPWRFLVGGSIANGSEVTGLVKAGGITGWLETVPKTETYLLWMQVAKDFNTAMSGGSPVAWDDTHPPVWDGLISPATTIGQFCFQDSFMQPYAGNIVERLSYYALAQ